MSKKSLFVIAIGPAGSGKGYVYKPMIEHLISQFGDNINVSKFYSTNIDEYVERNETYIRNTIDITNRELLNDPSVVNTIRNLNSIDECSQITNYMIDNKDSICNGKSNNKFIDSLLNATKLYSENYMTVRKPFEIINDANLDLWIADKKNIYFETTGFGGIDWLFKYTNLSNQSIRNDYRIIMVYPFVPAKTIVARAMYRFISRVNLYLDSGLDIDQYVTGVITKQTFNDSVFESPRIPYLVCEDNSLYNSIPKIQLNIANYMKQCQINNNNNLDLFLLYDNVKATPILTVHLGCDVKLTHSIQCPTLKSIIEMYGNEIQHQLIDLFNQLSNSCTVTKGGYTASYMKHIKKYIDY